MSYRIVVDFDLCESNAICMQVAPEVFEVRDDDFLYILDETPGEGLRGKVDEAVQRCPKQAISVAALRLGVAGARVCGDSLPSPSGCR